MPKNWRWVGGRWKPVEATEFCQPWPLPIDGREYTRRLRARRRRRQRRG